MPVDDLDKQIAGLSPAKRALLERKRKQVAAGSSVAPPIRRRNQSDGAPLSFSQERLWLIQQLDPQSHLYNVPRAVRMKGKLRLDALEHSLNEIVRRHEVLHTTFVAMSDQPAQNIAPALTIPLPLTDLSKMDQPEQESAIQRLALQEIHRPFDLATGPMLRARVLRLGEEDHVLVLAMHHIVSDGWTGSLLFEELGTLYQAINRGETGSLPELPIQYADYAVWQREWMQGAVLEKELAYWRERLADAPALVELPTDRARPDAPSYRGKKISLLLPKSLTDNLKTLSQRQGMTLFATLMAGLKILLYRWSGQEDLAVGTVSANRNQTEVEKLIGCFMNFLVLRDRMAPDKSSQEFLAQVNQTALAGFAHQDCPFEKLIEALNPERALNVNPLYNVALLMQNFPEMAFSSPTLEARFLDLDTEVAFLDLRFVATDTAAGIRVECEYNIDLFDAATVEQVLDGYRLVLEQLVSRPQSLLADFQIPEALAAQAMAAKKREQKLTLAITSTFTAEPVEESLAFWMRQLGIPSRIEFAPYNQVFQQLLDSSSLVAQNSGGVNVLLVRLEDWQRLEGEGAATSLQANVERNVSEFARALRSAAQRTATPYLLCLCPPSTAILADPAAADFSQRMEGQLASALIEAPGVHVVTSAQLLELYPVANYQDEYADRLGHIPYTPELFTALGTMVARRVHGIRSAPHKVIVLDCDHTLWKGVCGEEGALGVTVDGPRRALQQFMIAQHQSGMVLCLCSKNAEEDVAAVFEQNPGMVLSLDHIVASRINWQPKSQNLKELARELGLGLDSFIFIDDNPLECAEVQASCPEVLTLQLPHDAEQIPHFLQHVWAFDHGKVTEEDARRTSLYRQNVEREQLRQTAGSLEDFLAGLELQIEIRPMGAEDLGRVSQLTERTNQFNFTTIRRSEREIDELCQSGADCLVVNLCDRFGDYGLVGVVIASSRAEAMEVDTFLLSCRALGRKVEHHMLAKLGTMAQAGGLKGVDVPFVPSKKNQPALDFLESVGSQFKDKQGGRTMYRLPAPYAANAVKMRAPNDAAPEAAEPLKAPSPVSSPRSRVLAQIAAELSEVSGVAHAIEQQKVMQARSGEWVAPRTPTEEIVAGIWGRLLRVERVGIHDNFFRLGGHSLLATQVIARIRQALGAELPLRAMFESPTVAELTPRIEAARRAGRAWQAPPLGPRTRKKNPPLSFAQQRLWFLDQLEPGNPLYNIPQMIRMRGALHVEALEKSLNQIVRRHEALRTTFVTVANQAVQVIAAELSLPLPITDLSNLSKSEREAETERRAKAEALRPFDLAKGPMLRAQLLRLGAEEHVLLLTMHHVASDRWSMGLVSEELAALYTAFVQGRPSPLPELPVQYADYAAWQREWLTGEALESQITYWKQQLAGAPPVLELPTDRPRPAIQTYRGSTEKLMLPAELVEQLRALSQSEGVTLFMTLLAAFQTLLSRYSGQEDIVVGSPIANRKYAEIEPLIGFFVNTLAFRTDLSGDPSFRDLLVRVKEVSLGNYAHQDIPFEKLVEELQPARSLSHNPIFQVLFALQNAPMQALELPGLRLERLPVYTDTSMFDLSCYAIEVPEGLLLRAEYNTDLFDACTITRALNHFQVLLESIAARPGCRITELPLLTESERQQVVFEFNKTSANFPKDFCIHHFVEAQVERAPDAVALVCGNQRITYRDLNRRANQLAHFLAKRGVGPEVLVGICAARSPEMLVGILAIMKAGGAYVPLDPAYPKDRLACILEDAKAHVLLTQEALRSDLPPFGGLVVCLDTEWPAIAGEPETNFASPVKPENLGYVLFTSGSTGRPKGVALEHRSAATFIHWAKTVFTPEELRGVLFATSVCFDLSVFEMFVPLSVGGKIIVAENALYLPSLPAKDEVTLINTVPSAIAELVRMNGVPSSVQTVNLAGEALPDVLVEKIYAGTTVQRVYNLYGPTEDTTYSTYTLVPRGTAVTVGRPIANSQAYILDPHLNPLPVGVPGELYLAGEGLARGYFGHPELTAERFVRNPFSGQSSSRMYRTGDLCRWLPDGNIDYLGRIDNQVKLRGFRIELGEIESVLDQHPGVRQSVVVAREDEPGLKRLVAYVLPDLQPPPSVEDLRSHIKKSLPEFMIPAAFVSMDAFPLTPNGKVNRRALPAPEYDRPELQYVAPRNSTEEQIAGIWSEVLRVPQIGIRDDFFALGGHSLLATQVVSRLRQAFAAELPLRAVFEAPTVEGLAVRVEATQRVPESETIPRAARDRDLPLSFAQQRLWFLDQLEPDDPLYNIPWALRVSGSLDVKALKHSLDAVIERHEALRTTFSSSEGQPVQRIGPALRITPLCEDLTHLSDAERETEARRLVMEEAQRPFNLGRGPLLRAGLLRLNSKDHILLLNIHHIVSDRWSMGVLSQELAALYGAYIEGKPSPLPPLPVQYADFAVWQRQRMQGEFVEKQLAYWREQLKDAPPVLELPTDRPRLAAESFRGAVAPITFSKRTTEQLNALSRQTGATLFMTLLAGFQALLARYSGQDDIVVGAPIANRNRAELEGLIGFFANTLALRARLTGDPSFRELLGRVKESALGAYAHQDMPFEKLVEELRPERSLSHNPLVQVFFALQNAPLEALQLKGLSLKPIETDTKTAKGDMFFSLVESPEGLRGRVEYNTDLFDAATIERLLGHYQQLLEAAVADPAVQVSRLPLLSAAERRQLLVEWNATAFDYPRQHCLQQEFEAQVARAPQAVACVCGDEQLTYGELNARANQVAHFLKQQGAGPGERVGIFVERSLDMMVGLLGIQKSGAAYVPLDPAYPAERLRLTLDDAQVRVLLTQQSLLASMPEHQAEVVCLDSDWSKIAGHSTANLDSGVTPEDLVYVIFT
ncbi:MAG: amino acid adenylation domain-containing protein, partial [Acidobacteriia bacterium]|nr:amino acid adenylation domain-containing protein [Terriglobia bacterium]